MSTCPLYWLRIVFRFKEKQKMELEKTQAARDLRLEERAKRIAAKKEAKVPLTEEAA